MSIWTYINGSITLDTSATKAKLNKDGTYKRYTSGDLIGWVQTYLPYPEEQFSVDNPVAHLRYTEKEEPYAALDFVCKATSYPIIKRVVDKEILDINSGEQNIIAYFLNDSNSFNSSSSCFNNKQEEDLFKQHVMKNHHLWNDATWKDYKEYRHPELYSMDYCSESILTIATPIRGSEAAEIYDQFVNFLNRLANQDIMCREGIIKINDYMTTYILDFDYDHIKVTKTVKTLDDTVKSEEITYLNIVHHDYGHEKPLVSEIIAGPEKIEEHWIDEETTSDEAMLNE